MKRRNRNRRVVAGGVLAVFAAIGVAVAVMAPGAPGAGGALLPDIMQAVQEQGGPADGEQGADDGAASGRVVVHEEAATGEVGALPEQAKPDGDGDDGDKPDHEPGVALARLADGADEAAFREAAAGLPGVASVESVENGLARVALADDADEEAATAALGTLDQVDYSQPNFYYYLDDELLGGASAAGNQTQVVAVDNALVPSLIAAVSNDPRSNEQWGLDSVNAKAAWAKVDAKKVKNYAASVAVLDTGCLLDHEDLKGAVVAHYDATGLYEERAGKGQFGDIDGHGTHVCGIIAAVEGNKKGVAGVGHNKVGVVPVAVFRKTMSGVVADSETITKGLDWVTANAKRYKIKSVNMSLGHPLEGGLRTYTTQDAALHDAAENARLAGVLSCAAAGNDGNAAVNLPADALTTGLSVMALEQRNGEAVGRASYSSYNAPGSTAKSICAPGSGILSTVANYDNHSLRKSGSWDFFNLLADYASYSGTSMATPMVAGAAALVSAANPNLTPLQVREALLTTAKDLETPGFDEGTGYGELDLDAAVAAALDTSRWGKSAKNPLAGARVEAARQTYDGTPKEPAVEVILASGANLVAGVDFDVAYENNVAGGIARVKVTGRGAYAGGTAEGSFEIQGKSVLSEKVSVRFSGERTYSPNGLDGLSINMALGSKTLVQGRDFIPYFVDGVNVGERHFYVLGIGNYTGFRGPYAVTVTPKKMSYVNVGKIGDMDYTGYARNVDAEFSSLVTDPSGKTVGISRMHPGTDFLVEYENNVMPGKATVRLKGTGNYTGTRTVNFNIVADVGDLRDREMIACSDIPAQTFTGVSLKPAPAQILVGDKELVKGTHYTVTAAEENKFGTGTVTISGKGKYFKGSFDLDFEILNPLGSLEFVKGFTYNGSAVEQPGMKVLGRYNRSKFVSGNNYETRYFGNKGPGTGVVVVEGAGDYSGVLAQPFKIYNRGTSSVPANDLGSAAVAAIPDKVYTGFEQRPEPEVRVSGKKLVKGKDFTYSYFANDDVGTALVVVTGKGSYVGACVKEFNIVPASLDKDVKVTVRGKSFDGSAGFQDSIGSLALTMKKGDVELNSGWRPDFVATFANSFYPGTATVTLRGVGNFTGTVTKTYKIDYEFDPDWPEVYSLPWDNSPISFSGFEACNSGEVEGTAFDYVAGVYDGTAKKPITAVKFNGKELTLGTDYTLSYKNNVKAHQEWDGLHYADVPQAVITGKGAYKGKFTLLFGIVRAPMSATDVSGIVDRTFGLGMLEKHDATVTYLSKRLKEGKDYTQAYNEYNVAGTGRVLFDAVTGADVNATNFEGLTVKTYKVAQAKMADATVEPIPDQAYNGGEAICPKLDVEVGGYSLREGSHYTVTYANNKKRGKASATIKGIGVNCTGSKTMYFTIK